MHPKENYKIKHGHFDTFGKHFAKEFSFNTGGNCCSMNKGTNTGSFSPLYQSVEDDKLVVVLPLAGIEKETLKIRAKEDTLVIKAEIKEDLKKYLGKGAKDIRIKLQEAVDSGSAKAKYADGVLKVTFTVSETGEPVIIE